MLYSGGGWKLCEPKTFGRASEATENYRGESMRGEERLANWDRRLVALGILVVLVFVGAGLGTIGLGDNSEPEPPPGVNSPTPPPTPTRAPNTTADVSLADEAMQTMLDADAIAPGTSGSGRLALRNDGTDPGYLAFSSLSVVDSENGFTSPEAAVDDTRGDGELAENVEVRLSILYPDGDRVWLAGGDTEWVQLDSVTASGTAVGDELPAGQTATVVFEYRLPSETGNVVQSDTLQFDLTMTLRAAGVTPTATESG